jgi:hypothetical protein
MSVRDEEEEPKRSFKVEDRRRFVDTGAEAAAKEPSQLDAGDAVRAPSHEDHSPSPVDEGAEDVGAHAPFAEMTFSTFIMGITTQALMHLGEIVDPQQQLPRDLPAAKQMIDLLGILRDKTKGNLDAGEAQLLGDMLYDLRMRYVEVSRNG